MSVVDQADALAALLAARDDPMAACSAPWMRGLAKVPAGAAAPLAMSPRHPKAVGSYGPEIIAWAKREFGVKARWWQALALTRQFEHDKKGALVYREVIESGPRRIGKSTRLRLAACWRVENAERFHEPQLAMMVSKDLAIGNEIHSGSWRWAERHDPPWIVTRRNGAQAIERPEDGSRWLLRAPNACYGYDVGYGQADEAWDVDPQAIQDGLEPAQMERHSPQLHLTSTAHVKASSLMRRRLTAALRNADPSVLLLLWGAAPYADYDDVRTWRAASPHWTQARRELMARKYAAALAGERDPEIDDPDPVRGWAAQYLNVWPMLLSGLGEDWVMPNWGLCGTESPAPRFEALGVAVDLGRVWISVGALCTDGVRKHLAPVSVMRDGEAVTLRRRLEVDRAFVIGEIARIQLETGCTVALDRKGSTESLEADLVQAGVRVTPLALDDVVEGCSDVYDGIAAKELEHGDYPELNDAVKAAGWRKVGPKRRVWAPLNGDISMLDAVTCAVAGAKLNTSAFFGGWR